MLAKVNELDDLSRMIFLDLVYADQTAKERFHRVLKSTKPELAAAFLGKYSGNFRDKLDRWVAEAAPLEASGLAEAAAGLAALLDRVAGRRAFVEENTAAVKAKTREYRELMKSGFSGLGDAFTDQERGLPCPPLLHPVPETALRLALPAPSRELLRVASVFDCIERRTSHRKFSGEALTAAELSYLLWATQGIRTSFEHGRHALRTVPSGGARHPFETLLAIHNVRGIEPGMYRYLPYSCELALLFRDTDMGKRIGECCRGQGFAGDCASTFIWTAVPYRTEWRYLSEAKKIILQDSGHVGQNLHLACESIACGTCMIGAYDQKKIDAYVGVDGVDEFVVYVAPVGKV